jgi:hypothetical protein
LTTVVVGSIRTTYFWSAIISVIGTGMLLIVEITLVAFPPRLASANDLLTYVDPIQRLATGVWLIGVTLLTVLSYAVGIVVRDTVMAVLRRRRYVRYADQLAALRRAYGDRTVGDALSGLAVLRAIDRRREDADERAFQFMKGWLRSRARTLSIDYLEAEINIMFGLLVPMAAVPLVVTRIVAQTSTVGPVGWSISASLALGIALYIRWKAHQIQGYERGEALARVLYASFTAWDPRVAPRT